MTEVVDTYKSYVADILFVRNTGPIIMRIELEEFTEHFCPLVETYISDEESSEIIKHFYAQESILYRQINN